MIYFLWLLFSVLSLFLVVNHPHWATLIVSFLLVHQLGHLSVGVLTGLRIKPRIDRKIKIYLLENPPERWKDYLVAMGGPLFSLFFVFFLVYLYRQSPSVFLRRWVEIFIAVNLLNLFPAYPLDGGKMFFAWGMSLGRKFLYIGKILSVLIFLGLSAVLRFPLEFVLISLVYLVFGGKLPPEDVKGKKMGITALTLSALGYVFLFLLNLLPGIYLYWH